MIRTRGGRNDIAEIIEKVMIPSTQKYTVPEDNPINQGAQERMEYKDHTIEYLEQTVLLLRETMDTVVERGHQKRSNNCLFYQMHIYYTRFYVALIVFQYIELNQYNNDSITLILLYRYNRPYNSVLENNYF